MNQHLAVHVGNLPTHANYIVSKIDENFDTDNRVQRQVLCLAEETGEFVASYRRWSGNARRHGSMAEMENELADVLVVAFVLAEILNIDIERVLSHKLDVIYTRGWKDANGN